MSEQETNRRNVHDWDDPHFEHHERSTYNPLLWVLMTVDLLLCLRWWLWHKYQSVKADRWAISHNAQVAMHNIKVVENRDMLKASDRERLRESRKLIAKTTDEQNINSEFIERHREDGDE